MCPPEPLPVLNMRPETDEKNSIINISWTPNPESTQEGYKVSYHEVESAAGDSSTISTNKTKITLDTLLPGRNYSISVQAVSKDMESDETNLYVLTRPSAPIIEDLRPIIDGLNISWKSDVNSRQDKYEVQCVRNDTLDRIVRTTNDTRLVLTNLYPGAGYMVKVFAISHYLRSEPHEYFQPVCKYIFNLFLLIEMLEDYFRVHSTNHFFQLLSSQLSVLAIVRKS